MLSLDLTEYISKLAMEYRMEDDEDDSEWQRKWPLVLTGPAGCGKTHAVIKYCSSRKTSYYFSFKNISTALALRLFPEYYPDILDECPDWECFFEKLRVHIGNTRQAVIVFDDWDERKIDESFLIELNNMLGKQEKRNIFAILLARKTPVRSECFCQELITLNPAKIKRTFRNLTMEDVLRLYAVSGGYTGLMSFYDPEKVFDENLSWMFDPKSHYFRSAEDQMKDLFRAPESYSAILYAMATERHKLKDIASFAGFSLNKCEKYLRSLMQEGIVHKEKIKSDDLRSCVKYDIASSYLKLWSRFLLGKSDIDEFFDRGSESIKEYIDNALVRDAFRRECFIWAGKRESSLLYPSRILTEIQSNHDVKVGDMVFDFVQRKRDRMLVMKIWTDQNTSYGNDEFEKIAAETEKELPFYNTEFFLFSIRRFSDSMWKVANRYDNVHLIESRFLSGDR